MDDGQPLRQSPALAVRLVIAFSLGLPVGFGYVTAKGSPSWNGGSQPMWVQAALPAALLVAAALLSLLPPRPTAAGRPALDQRAMASGGLVLLAALTVVTIFALRDRVTSISPSSAGPLPILFLAYVLLALPLVPLSIGAAAAFIVGGGRGPVLALAVGTVAWLGAALHIGLLAVLDYLTVHQVTPGAMSEIELPIMLGFLGVGFAFAALGGVLGRLLRISTLRPA